MYSNLSMESLSHSLPRMSGRCDEGAADDSDIALMLRVRAGEIDAFEVLVRRHQASVFGTAQKMLGDATEAEDIAQQTFVRMFQAARTYEPSAKFTTWMFTVLRNLVFTELRKRQRRRMESIDAPHPETEAPQELADPDGLAPSDELLQQELEREIRRALDALPEQQRLAMVLLRYEEISYEEIARVLSTTVPSVKSLIFRARTTLKERLKAYLGATSGREGR